MTTTITEVPIEDNAVLVKWPVLAVRKAVLRIDDLRKSFGGEVVLDGISTELRVGEVVLLRGDNGSGKTTLLNILSGNLEPDSGSIHLETNGAVEHFDFPRKWWQNLNPFDHFTPERVAREGVGRTWQDVRLFGTLSLTDNIAVATPNQTGENPLNVLFSHKATRHKERQNGIDASDRLAGLGLAGRDQSSADRISLGQTKRVAIARAVQGGARILFLDEPLAGLDTDGIGNVLNLLRALAQEHKVTLVIVEHVFNIPRILDLADTVWTLRNGKITVEPPATVRESHNVSLNGDVVKWLANELGLDAIISHHALHGGAILWKLRRATHSQESSKCSVLDINNLAVRRGRRLVIGKQEPDAKIQGLTFTLAQGELAVLQAPNGWGKTTLLDALAGIIPIDSGDVRLEKLAISHLPTWERVRRGLAYLPAKANVFPQLEVRESLRIARNPTYTCSLPESFQSRQTSSLSGGERQKLAIDCLSRSAKCHLLDEPFSALDFKSLESLSPLLALHKRTGAAMLIALPSSVERATTTDHHT